MPYITKDARNFWKEELNALLEYVTSNTPVGELNYLITKILLKALGKSPNYERYNAIIGVLECCKLELYRRQIVPYEEKKIKENGKLDET
jgi:hypothetical protein